MIKIAKIFGLDTDLESDADLTYLAADGIENVLLDIGLPTHISQIGIKEADFEEIAEKTLPAKRMVRNNPRIPDKESLMELLGSAF